LAIVTSTSDRFYLTSSRVARKSAFETLLFLYVFEREASSSSLEKEKKKRRRKKKNGGSKAANATDATD